MRTSASPKHSTQPSARGQVAGDMLDGKARHAGGHRRRQYELVREVAINGSARPIVRE
jgi:hypothetical protein